MKQQNQGNQEVDDFKLIIERLELEKAEALFKPEGKDV